MKPFLSFLVIVLAACGGESQLQPDPVLPDVSNAKFVTGINHPYLPFPVGASWSYEAVSDEGVETIVVSVPGDSKQINGVTATVVRDTASLNGELIEDTHDYYAQDSEGNVWYLGEDTCVFENGVCVDTEGSWLWGKQGALPGIAMPAEPTVNNQPYRQEFFLGHAEDVGEVLAIGAAANPPGMQFNDCVKTQDTSTLDKDLNEFKYYCHGIGLVLTEEGAVTERLIEHSGL